METLPDCSNQWGRPWQHRHAPENVPCHMTACVPQLIVRHLKMAG